MVGVLAYRLPLSACLSSDALEVPLSSWGARLSRSEGLCAAARPLETVPRLTFGLARLFAGYGGGMSSAKAALESDTKVLAYEAGQKWQVRVNTISAGPLGSRAAKAIGFIDDMIRPVSLFPSQSLSRAWFTLIPVPLGCGGCWAVRQAWESPSSWMPWAWHLLLPCARAVHGADACILTPMEGPGCNQGRAQGQVCTWAAARSPV